MIESPWDEANADLPAKPFPGVWTSKAVADQAGGVYHEVWSDEFWRLHDDGSWERVGK